MLDRIGCKVKNIPEYEKVACDHNAHVRLHSIKQYIHHMTNHQKAMIFAWAFAVDHQGDEAFF
ncbi:MAG: hypothetical protein OXC30_06485 [Alphaproteobacteria bacterium]|nr:hypothetical protein [Alphaproteobacteria bacterium]